MGPAVVPVPKSVLKILSQATATLHQHATPPVAWFRSVQEADHALLGAQSVEMHLKEGLNQRSARQHELDILSKTNFRLLWIPSCPCCTSCSRQLTTSCHLASSGVPRERRTSNTNESNTDDERRDTDTRARSSKTLWIPDQETAPPRDARMRKRIPPPEHGSTQNSQRVL